MPFLASAVRPGRVNAKRACGGWRWQLVAEAAGCRVVTGCNEVFTSAWFVEGQQKETKKKWGGWVGHLCVGKRGRGREGEGNLGLRTLALLHSLVEGFTPSKEQWQLQLFFLIIFVSSKN